MQATTPMQLSEREEAAWAAGELISLLADLNVIGSGYDDEGPVEGPDRVASRVGPLGLLVIAGHYSLVLTGKCSPLPLVPSDEKAAQAVDVLWAITEGGGRARAYRNFVAEYRSANGAGDKANEVAGRLITALELIDAFAPAIETEGRFAESCEHDEIFDTPVGPLGLGIIGGFPGIRVVDGAYVQLDTPIDEYRHAVMSIYADVEAGMCPGHLAPRIDRLIDLHTVLSRSPRR